MIIDNHVHVGWFTDGYHSPKEVWSSEMAAGVDGMAVASTSTCAELYKNVCRELRELIRFGGRRISPILWLTPKMIKRHYALSYMLHSKIQWAGVKIHSEAHPEWVHNNSLLCKALNVARHLDVPVMIHTGNFDCCHAGLFKCTIEHNTDLTFVLAHGRPIGETIDVLKCCNNAYVDTAFMPREDVEQLISANLQERILFGTDAPINKVFYPESSTEDYIRQSIFEVSSAVGGDIDILSKSVYRTS